MTSLRRFGFGKNSFESKIMKEVEIFVDLLSEPNGQPIDINVTINTSISNIICSIVLGKHFEHSNPDFFQEIVGWLAVKY